VNYGTAGKFGKGATVMMAGSLRDEYRLSPLHHAHEYRSADRSQSAAALALALPFAGPEQRRTDTGHVAPLKMIRQLVAAIRLSRARARSRRQLRELNDHLLKDIGLKRDVLVYEFPKPREHWD